MRMHLCPKLTLNHSIHSQCSDWKYRVVSFRVTSRRFDSIAHQARARTTCFGTYRLIIRIASWKVARARPKTACTFIRNTSQRETEIETENHGTPPQQNGHQGRAINCRYAKRPCAVYLSLSPSLSNSLGVLSLWCVCLWLCLCLFCCDVFVYLRIFPRTRRRTGRILMRMRACVGRARFCSI